MLLEEGISRFVEEGISRFVCMRHRPGEHEAGTLNEAD